MPASLLRRVLALPALVLALVVSAVAVAPAAQADRADRIRTSTSIALNQIGDPYRYGAAGPNAFDCSGLIYYATHRAGFSGVPRSSSAQAGHMRRIPKSKLRRGDFMFFYNGGGVYHAAIFLGWKSGRAYLLHAPSTGSRVQRTKTWTSSWFAGTLR